ncbi:MGDG synthase family glycosyltransferase [Clostridium sp. DJ247]|uniref:MGDG synthase family glycosyltransferase n=1 Tax=Clostridium sp. DJ247 TaxID=2726188 RepID=UPI00162A61DB|nr:glycosyltransferase [Clostridium sp. DJ247]MBC2578801.1 glycosyltransferase [Clostridium sp. DJ247]
MLKTILIISSNFTGHGHKSITESLNEHFKENNTVKVHVVDGFSLGGKALLNMAKSYGPITRNSENLWELIWELSSIRPSFVNEFIELVIENNFINLLKEVRPDLILSVHPNFNGSIINILEKRKINIPLVTLIADLVSIYPLWADPRVNYIISPTVEAKDKCIEYGVSEEKIKLLGFPVRSRFQKPTEVLDEYNDYNTDTPLRCLIMSGGEGVGNMKKIAEILLNNFNCTVKIVAGRNTRLRNRLQQSLGEKYGDKVEIYGFLENIQDLMLSCDIAITRGSPNVMMEAIACNLPLVITGALPGQEEGNPEFAEKYNLGVVCEDIKNIKNTISDLLSNNAEKLNKIKDSQRNYNDPNVSKNIVNFLLNIENNSNFIISPIDFDSLETTSNTILDKHLKKIKLPILNKSKY